MAESDGLWPPGVKHVSGAEEPEAGYWAALGEFIHRFSKIEQILQIMLWTYAEVSHSVARSIFSGARGDTCRDFINRICDATGRIDEKTRLEPVFAQIGHIGSARNAVVHWGSSIMEDDSVMAINHLLANTPDRIKYIPMSTQTINDMSVDLRKINVILALDTVDFMASKIAAGDQVTQSIKYYRNIFESKPWRYKPPQPPPPEKGTRARRRERRRQPDASPKSP